MQVKELSCRMTNIVEEGRQQKIRIGRIGGIQYMQGCMVILNVISPSNRGHINLENGNRGESKPETPSCNQRVSDFRIYLLGEVGAHFMHGAHKDQGGDSIDIWAFFGAIPGAIPRATDTLVAMATSMALKCLC